MAQPGWTDEAEARRLRTLYRLLSALVHANAPEDVYEAAVTGLLDATTADRAAILIFDEDGAIRFKAWRDLPVEYREAVIGRTPWPKGTVNAKPVVVPDVPLQEGTGAVAFIPLALEAGVFGEFVLCYAEPHQCTAEDLDIAEAIAGHVARVAGKQHVDTASLTLAAIVESSDDAIIGKDLNGIITSWNAGAERIFGYTSAEAIGKSVSMLAAPERLNEMPEILNQIRRGQRIHHYETRRRRKDGQTIDVSLTVSPVRNAAGRIIGASKIARDISDRKRAEEERAVLLAREREARETAELLNRVGPRLATQLDLENLAQVVTDIATVLTGAESGSFLHNAVNEKGETHTLYSQSGYALSGAPREAFAGFPMPGGVVRCDDATQDPRYGRNPPHSGMPENRLPVRSYLAAPVVSQSGEVLGGLFFGHSIPGKFTESHEAIVTGVAAQAAIAMDNARLFEQAQWAQKELRRANEELRRANQDLETFAYSASHDLQEPLRTIALSAQLLEADCGQTLRGDAATFLASILTGANHMNDLIQNLLAYTKATKHEGPPPGVEAGSVLASVLENLQGPIKEAGAVVTSGHLPIVRIHESRLAQLFQNLIGNALKYRGKEAPQIHISAGERDGWTVFSVTDNGIGIELQYADRIFLLFKRLHSREEYPGTGIGLALCQRIVEQYGGRIWLDKSVLGEGSTFCFAVPAQTR